MRQVNIGFNVKTSDAVKDLKKFQSELIEIQKLVTDISKKSLDIKIDKSSVKNITSDMDKTAKAIQNSFKTSLSTLDEVIERANRAGATIGKNAKLDSTSASKYSEKLKEVIRTLEAIKQVDVSILDSKELTSLNVTTQQVIKTFNTLERDLDKFTETGVHSTKEVEKLSRKLEYMKKAVQEAFESSGKSNMEEELKRVSTQIDKNIDSLYKSIENIDYRELMKLQEEVKDTSKEYDKFVKLLKQPVKIEVEAPKDFGLKEVSKFYGKEAIYPKANTIKEPSGLAKQIENISIQLDLLKDKKKYLNFDDVEKNLVSLKDKLSKETFDEKSIYDFRLEVEKLKVDLKDLSKTSEIFKKVNPASIINYTVEAQNMQKLKDLGIKLTSELGKMNLQPSIPKEILKQRMLQNQPFDYGITQTQKIGGKVATQPSISKDEFKRRDLEASIIDNLSKLHNTTVTSANTKELDNLILKLKALKAETKTIVDGSRLPTLEKELKDVTGKIKELNATKIKPDTKGLSSTLMQFDLFRRSLDLLIMATRQGFTSFMELENAVYALKVVGGTTVPTIQNLKSEMIKLSASSKFTASEFAKAVDETMRMGKSYEEAMIIVQNASKLAIASGENLSDATAIVNKIFVALGVNGRDTGEVMEFLHGTAIATATDLEGLGITRCSLCYKVA